MNATPSQGTLPEIRLISRATLEKRVRRALAAKGHRLLKSRPGTAAFREYGLYAVENGLRRIIAVNHDLMLLAHEFGVMADNERLKPRYVQISVATHRHVDEDQYFVIGKPGTGRAAFDTLAGPFAELALAEEARDLMRGGRSHE